jgi:hypothetical protein
MSHSMTILLNPEKQIKINNEILHSFDFAGTSHF